MSTVEREVTINSTGDRDSWNCNSEQLRDSRLETTASVISERRDEPRGEIFQMTRMLAVAEKLNVHLCTWNCIAKEELELSAERPHRKGERGPLCANMLQIICKLAKSEVSKKKQFVFVYSSRILLPKT